MRQVLSLPSAAAMPPTATATRSASDFEPLVLLQVVREIAELSEADEPPTVSTRLWDRTRPLSNRFPDAPAARRIAEHLGLPWRKVVELAFIGGRGQATALGHALNEKEGNWLTPEYCDYILSLVARRLNVPTLTPGQYRSERNAMLDAQCRRVRRPGQLRLPTEEQVAAIAGSWDQALAHAGLRARAGSAGQRSRSQPAAIIDVLDRCYEAHGTEATAADSEVFARANGIPYPRRERGKPWVEYVREWKERRRAESLPVPDAPPPKAQRPDYSADVGAARPGERRAKKRWDDLDEVADWVMSYLKTLGRRERSTQRGYVGWARGQEGAPSSSAFDKHGGWAAVRAEAQRRMRAR